MLIFYVLEDRNPWFILAFAGACALASVYRFLQDAWPFGIIEAIWACVAMRRWRTRNVKKNCPVASLPQPETMLFHKMKPEQMPPMISVRTIRWLRASLLACFAVAQVVAIVFLIHDHTLNVYETMPVAAHGHPRIKPTIANPDADHHHGALDLHDQCCVLHALAGPLPQMINAVPVSFASVRTVPDDSIALTGSNPPVLDRPPRTLPLS